MSMKLIVLFSVLLDQFLMFLVYSINFYAHNNKGGPRNFQLALILLYGSLKERSFEDHCNAP